MAVLATAMAMAAFASAGRTQSLDRINKEVRDAPAKAVPDRVSSPAAMAAAPLVQVASPTRGEPVVASLTPADERIVASRIRMLEAEDIRDELGRLQVLVDKTGGPREREAMAYVRTVVGDR